MRAVTFRGSHRKGPRACRRAGAGRRSSARVEDRGEWGRRLSTGSHRSGAASEPSGRGGARRSVLEWRIGGERWGLSGGVTGCGCQRARDGSGLRRSTLESRNGARRSDSYSGRPTREETAGDTQVQSLARRPA